MENTKIINLTPHVLNIIGADGTTVNIAPEATPARVKSTQTVTSIINGLEVFTTTYGAVEGLPAPAPGVVYVVSRMVKSAVPSRPDVLVPGALVRDTDGRVIGARGLANN